jgi:8-oxo-dGTP pyrophosphatase MutT (NUDIX family)
MKRRNGGAVIDRLFQAGYWLAYRLLRLYWAVRHPLTHGALVAVWHRGRILLVRTSYAGYYTTPGGYVHRGEATRRAAARELAEEVGIAVADDELVPALEITHDWEDKRDHVCLYRLDLIERPDFRPDNREVIEAAFYEPGAALTLELFPPVRQHIEAVSQASGSAGGEGGEEAGVEERAG